MLPEAVLEKARDSLLSWEGSGMSVMEVSHRGKAFASLAESFEQRLRSLLDISDDYRVLYLSGGATGQFAAIPLNLRHLGEQADYIITGQWSKKAAGEAGKFTKVRIGADSFGELRLPRPDETKIGADAAYAHYTHNETIIGVQFREPPDAGKVPLVGDFSSSLLSAPLDISRHGVVYACTQKNIGAAGTAVVIVHRDLIAKDSPGLPSILDWSIQDANQSMYNTPATFNWYLSDLVLEWCQQQGGLAALEARNREKAARLYEYIDGSGWYQNPIPAEARSIMNIPFTLADSQHEAAFLEQSQKAGLSNLKGHRSIGGMRASIYNAMPMAGIEALIDFMRDFAQGKG